MGIVRPVPPSPPLNHGKIPVPDTHALKKRGTISPPQAVTPEQPYVVPERPDSEFKARILKKFVSENAVHEFLKVYITDANERMIAKDIDNISDPNLLKIRVFKYWISWMISLSSGHQLFFCGNGGKWPSYAKKAQAPFEPNPGFFDQYRFTLTRTTINKEIIRATKDKIQLDTSPKGIIKPGLSYAKFWSDRLRFIGSIYESVSGYFLPRVQGAINDTASRAAVDKATPEDWKVLRDILNYYHSVQKQMRLLSKQYPNDPDYKTVLSEIDKAMARVMKDIPQYHAICSAKDWAAMTETLAGMYTDLNIIDSTMAIDDQLRMLYVYLDKDILHSVSVKNIETIARKITRNVLKDKPGVADYYVRIIDILTFRGTFSHTAITRSVYTECLDHLRQSQDSKVKKDAEQACIMQLREAGSVALQRDSIHAQLRSALSKYEQPRSAAEEYQRIIEETILNKLTNGPLKGISLDAIIQAIYEPLDDSNITKKVHVVLGDKLNLFIQNQDLYLVLKSIALQKKVDYLCWQIKQSLFILGVDVEEQMKAPNIPAAPITRDLLAQWLRLTMSMYTKPSYEKCAKYMPLMEALAKVDTETQKLYSVFSDYMKLLKGLRDNIEDLIQRTQEYNQGDRSLLIGNNQEKVFAQAAEASKKTRSIDHCFRSIDTNINGLYVLFGRYDPLKKDSLSDMFFSENLPWLDAQGGQSREAQILLKYSDMLLESSQLRSSSLAFIFYNSIFALQTQWPPMLVQQVQKRNMNTELYVGEKIGITSEVFLAKKTGTTDDGYSVIIDGAQYSAQRKGTILTVTSGAGYWQYTIIYAKKDVLLLQAKTTNYYNKLRFVYNDQDISDEQRSNELKKHIDTRGAILSGQSNRRHVRYDNSPAIIERNAIRSAEQLFAAIERNVPPNMLRNLFITTVNYYSWLEPNIEQASPAHAERMLDIYLAYGSAILQRYIKNPSEANNKKYLQEATVLFTNALPYYLKISNRSDIAKKKHLPEYFFRAAYECLRVQEAAFLYHTLKPLSTDLEKYFAELFSHTHLLHGSKLYTAIVNTKSVLQNGFTKIDTIAWPDFIVHKVFYGKAVEDTMGVRGGHVDGIAAKDVRPDVIPQIFPVHNRYRTYEDRKIDFEGWKIRIGQVDVQKRLFNPRDVGIPRIQVQDDLYEIELFFKYLPKVFGKGSRSDPEKIFADYIQHIKTWTNVDVLSRKESFQRTREYLRTDQNRLPEVLITLISGKHSYITKDPDIKATRDTQTANLKEFINKALYDLSRAAPADMNSTRAAKLLLNVITYMKVIGMQAHLLEKHYPKITPDTKQEAWAQRIAKLKSEYADELFELVRELFSPFSPLYKIVPDQRISIVKELFDDYGVLDTYNLYDQLLEHFQRTRQWHTVLKALQVRTRVNTHYAKSGVLSLDKIATKSSLAGGWFDMFKADLKKMHTQPVKAAEIALLLNDPAVKNAFTDAQYTEIQAIVNGNEFNTAVGAGAYQAMLHMTPMYQDGLFALYQSRQHFYSLAKELHMDNPRQTKAIEVEMKDKIDAIIARSKATPAGSSLKDLALIELVKVDKYCAHHPEVGIIRTLVRAEISRRVHAEIFEGIEHYRSNIQYLASKANTPHAKLVERSLLQHYLIASTDLRNPQADTDLPEHIQYKKNQFSDIEKKQILEELNKKAQVVRGWAVEQNVNAFEKTLSHIYERIWMRAPHGRQVLRKGAGIDPRVPSHKLFLDYVQAVSAGYIQFAKGKTKISVDSDMKNNFNAVNPKLADIMKNIRALRATSPTDERKVELMEGILDQFHEVLYFIVQNDSANTFLHEGSYPASNIMKIYTALQELLKRNDPLLVQAVQFYQPRSMMRAIYIDYFRSLVPSIKDKQSSSAFARSRGDYYRKKGESIGTRIQKMMRDLSGGSTSLQQKGKMMELLKQLYNEQRIMYERAYEDYLITKDTALIDQVSSLRSSSVIYIWKTPAADIPSIIYIKPDAEQDFELTIKNEQFALPLLYLLTKHAPRIAERVPFDATTETIKNLLINEARSNQALKKDLSQLSQVAVIPPGADPDPDVYYSFFQLIQNELITGGGQASQSESMAIFYMRYFNTLDKIIMRREHKGVQAARSVYVQLKTELRSKILANIKDSEPRDIISRYLPTGGL